MAILLDTHVWLWSQARPDRLGAEATALLLEPEQSLFVATISALEIARLIEAGKVEIQDPLQQWIKESLELLQCATVELSHEIAAGAYGLPAPFHRDPADRVLVATARTRGLSLMTADQRILEYVHVDTVDVRR